MAQRSPIGDPAAADPIPDRIEFGGKVTRIGSGNRRELAKIPAFTILDIRKKMPRRYLLAPFDPAREASSRRQRRSGELPIGDARPPDANN